MTVAAMDAASAAPHGAGRAAAPYQQHSVVQRRSAAAVDPQADTSGSLS